MKVKYDLHIHSTLSPCCDMLSTPNNLLNMAMLAELELIAITDHNSVKQLEYILEIAKSYDFLVIVGMEVTVEDFHVLVYFKNLDFARNFEKDLQPYFIQKEFNGAYGQQVIFDIFDIEVETHKQDLHSINIKYNDFIKLARANEALVILAHIDRIESSALKKYTLDELEFDGIEFSKYANEDFKSQYSNYRSIINSDAHSIAEIGIIENFLEIKELSVDAFFALWK